MDERTVIEISKILIGLVATGVGAFIGFAIKAVVSELISTRDAVILMKEQLKSVIEEAKAIPKLKEDINSFHAWKREIQDGESA